MSIYSLKNQQQFDLVNRHGFKHYGTYMMMIMVNDFLQILLQGANKENLNTEFHQNLVFLGMKVSTKFSKKAVIRNKTKRRIRHLARNIVNDPKIETKGKAFIVIPKKGFEDIEFQELEKDFYSIFKKLS